MKKISFWSMMMLVAMVLPLMTACGSDDEDDKNVTIIGTWTREDGNFYNEYVFWEDNTYREYYSKQQYYSEIVGRYRISANVLYLTFEKKKEYSNIGLSESTGGSKNYTFKLTSRTLTLLRGTDKENIEKIEGGYGMVFNRK